MNRQVKEAKIVQERQLNMDKLFKPQINDVSRSLIRNEDSFMNHQRQVREKIEQKRSELMY